MTTFKKTRKLYDCDTIKRLAGVYAARGGQAVELVPGSLGYGLTVMFGDGLRTCVVNEIAVNTQYSLHSIRFYNDMPKKYADMVAAAV